MKDVVCFLERQKNWIKPVVLLFLLYPATRILSSTISIDGMTLSLYDPRLPLFSALLVLYGIRALPALGLFLMISACIYPSIELPTTASQIFAAAGSYLLYSGGARKRGATSFGHNKLVLCRIGWLVCYNTLLFSLFQFTSPFNTGQAPATDFFSIQNFIYVQGVLNSCLVGIPFCYLVLRSCHHPRWGLRYLKQCQIALGNGPHPISLIIWLSLLSVVLYCLVAQQNGLLLFTYYSILLLLPVILWGTVFIGNIVIAPVWALALILLGSNNDGYIPPIANSVQQYLTHQAVTSTMIFVFSLAIVVVGVLVSHNHGYIRKISYSSLTEPNTGLPNLWALKADLARDPDSGLCLIHFPELWQLTQMHGLNIRFAFIVALARHLVPFLQEGERVYYYPGYGLFIRQNNQDENRIKALYQSIEYYRFSWGSYHLGLHSGLGYTRDCLSQENIFLIAGRLTAAATHSLTSGQPEIAQSMAENQPGGGNFSPAEIRHLLQQTIDQQNFVLVAQPIISTGSEATYHEVLIRMRTACNKLIFPDAFLPFACDAGITAQVDMAVIEQVFRFIQSTEDSASAGCFSINLMPQTLCKVSFACQVTALFHQYHVAPERIVFEVVETDILDRKQTMDNLRQLRQFGCKIAIDDFGTGYASHSRLKNIDADILKIDGSFVRNVLTSQFDHHTVVAFYQAACIRNMQVVAEFVENEAIKQALEKIGVNWLQGYHTGKPVPIETLSF